MSAASPRQTLRSLVAGQGNGSLAIPLALHTSARIAERDAEDFVYDPTQLANALRDLIEAVAPDGVPVTAPAVLLTECKDAAQVLASDQLRTALEATRRLRSSYADRVVLLAALPGPAQLVRRLGVDATAAGETVLALGREFLSAGADVILVDDDAELADASLATLANVARFHQALALASGADRYGLAGVRAAGLGDASPAPGVTVTDRELARETDLAALRDWVDAIRAL